MAQEENVFGCSYSGSGGGNGGGRGGGSGGGGGSNCRSKKIKPKKVPQRGLGVAQLEKIRIEEEQKNVIASSPSDGCGATSFLGVEKFSRPNLAPFHNSPPPPPSSSSNLSSPNALFRHSQSAPNIEILQESCSVSKRSNGEIGSRPMLWGGDYNHHHNLHHHHHHHPFAYDLPYEPPAAAVLPQRSHHFQPPSSMVNSISPSSVLASHLEPPSNQSSLPNNYAPQWKEEDKMVGMKRSYPFSLQSPPPPSSAPQHDLALCSSGYTPPIAEPRNKCIRGSPLLDRSRPSEVAGDGEALNGDFLTLAPPSSNFKYTHPSQPESSGSVKESFNFFPVKLFANQRSNGVRNGNGEEGGDHTVDLNLKL